MVERENVEFAADAGVTLRGWLFLPDRPGPYPAITMAHGYAGIKEHGLEPFARAFAEGGFAVLLHDHRAFGASDGEPRQDVDPWQQITDWRRAISYLESRPEVDADRIGLWGTSYAGGHAIAGRHRPPTAGGNGCTCSPAVTSTPTSNNSTKPVLPRSPGSANTSADRTRSALEYLYPSWFGTASKDFAQRTGRMELIDGRGLKALLKEHLDIDALIGLPKLPVGWHPQDLR